MALSATDPSIEAKNVAQMRKYSLVILLVIVAGFIYLDFWSYSVSYYRDPGETARFLSGHAPPSVQYRIAVIFAANFLAKATHLGTRHVFALFDLVSLLITVMLLRALLFRSRVFLESKRAVRWLQIFIFLGLTSLYLSWATWYQKPETFINASYVAISLYLISAVRSRPLVFGALLCLAIIQGFIRADIAILFSFALIICTAFLDPKGFLAGRKTLMAAGVLCCAVSYAIFWYITHKVFPQTKPDFQLIYNFKHVNQWGLWLIFIVPLAYTFAHAAKTRRTKPGPENTILLTSLFYLGSWLVLGRMAEVRIFLPFALALMPQTVHALVSGISLSPESQPD